jgi:hypothetical protein
MFKKVLAVVGLAVALSAALSSEQDPKVKPLPTKTTTSVWRPVKDHPDKGHFVHFIHRDRMKAKQPAKSKTLLDPTKLPNVTLPVDWAKSISFPMDLNDTYGDCYYAAICHAHNTWGGNVGTSPSFGLAAIKTRYFTLSGGDNGLGDSDVQGEMTSTASPYQGYVADVPGTSIVDFQYLDTTDPAAVSKAMNAFGVVVFTLAVPDAWINNSNTGDMWDAPATANQNNGHAVIWNGVDAGGRYKLQTWGSYVWITPAGVKVCDPSGWVAFSTKWFDPKTGLAPNGLHITALAAAWQAAGGNAIPAAVISSFPPAGPPSPPNPPNPPVGGNATIVIKIAGQPDQTLTFTVPTGVTITGATTLKELLDLVGKPGAVQPPPKKTSQLDSKKYTPGTADWHLEQIEKGAPAQRPGNFPPTVIRSAEGR